MTQNQSITPPLICHLCEAFLTPSSDSWPSQDCREVDSQSVEGLVNAQREVGPWHAEAIHPSIHPSHGKKLAFHAHLHLSTQSALLSHPGSPEHLRMKTGSMSMPDPAHRTCCHTWGRSQGTESIVPFSCRAVSLELWCCSAPLLGHSAPLLMKQRSVRSLVLNTSSECFHCTPGQTCAGSGFGYPAPSVSSCLAAGSPQLLSSWVLEPGAASEPPLASARPVASPQHQCSCPDLTPTVQHSQGEQEAAQFPGLNSLQMLEYHITLAAECTGRPQTLPQTRTCTR